MLRVGDLVKFKEPYARWYDSSRIGVIIYIYRHTDDKVRVYWDDQNVQNTTMNILELVEYNKNENLS